MAGSSVIGALRVNLGLNSALFERGLGQAGRRVRQARVQFMQLASVGAAIAAALGTIGVATINAANEINRLSQVANAAPDQFQRWAAAASSVGIEQDKLADILKDTTDRVGDFMATGGGPMADFFENIAPRVGVTADMFRDLSGPDALQLYVDTLQRAGASQADMTFYMEALASDATLLIPLLRDGGAEMQRLGDRAADLGAVMDGATVQSLSRMRQSLTDVQSVLTGVRNQIGAAVAPTIRGLADAFVSVAAPGAALRQVFDGLVRNIGPLVSALSVAIGLTGLRYVGALVAARVATFALTLATGGLVGSLRLLSSAIARTGIGALVIAAGYGVDAFFRLNSAIGDSGEAFAMLEAVAQEVVDRIVESVGLIPLAFQYASAQMQAYFFGALRAMGQGFQDFTWQVAEGINSLFPGMQLRGADISLGLTGLSDLESDALRAAAGIGFDMRNMAADLTRPLQSIERIREVLANAGSAAGSTADALAEVRDILNGVGDAAAGAGGGAGGGAAGAVRDLNEELDETRNRAQAGAGALTDLFMAGTEGADSFRDAMRNLFSSIARSQMSAGLTGLGQSDPIMGAILSGLGGLIGSNANGTNYWRGGLTQVNERGGEIMNLPRGTQIIPHDVSMAMARNGGGGAVQVIGGDLTLSDNGAIMARVQVMAAGARKGAVSDMRSALRSQPKALTGLA